MRVRVFPGCTIALLCNARPRACPSLIEGTSVSDLQARRVELLQELADVDRALEVGAAEEEESPVALGSRTSAFEPAFGYLSRSAGVYTEALSPDGANLPSSAWDLAIRNFRRELPELLKE